jgi:hypothetical protein
MHLGACSSICCACSSLALPTTLQSFSMKSCPRHWPLDVGDRQLVVSCFAIGRWVLVVGCWLLTVVLQLHAQALCVKSLLCGGSLAVGCRLWVVGCCCLAVQASFLRKRLALRLVISRWLWVVRCCCLAARASFALRLVLGCWLSVVG